MRRFLSSGFLLAALAIVPLSNARAEEPARTTASAKDRAREAMAKGLEAFRAGKTEAARDALLESFSIHPSHDSAGVLGQVEMSLGDYPSAAEHLQYCVEHFPTAEKREILKKAEERLAEVRLKVVELSIFANIDGSSVAIDGKPIGKTPLGKKYVSPGEHTVVVESPSGDSEKRIEKGSAGGKATVTVVFPSSKPTPSSGLETSATPEEHPQDSEKKPSTVESKAITDTSSGWHRGHTTLVVGSTLTVGAAVGAIVFASEASSKDKESQGLRGELGSSTACDAGANAATCSSLVSALDARNSANLMSGVFLGTAIGLGVATAVVTYLVWPEPSKERTSVSFVPFASPSSGGLQLSGSF